MPNATRGGARAVSRKIAPAFDDRAFRNALGRFATGVIVLTVGPARDPHAMTANAFMSGSLNPPLVVVSVGRKARMHDRLAGTKRFGVSILGLEQEAASRHFAGQPIADFAPAFQVLSGVPVLTPAAVVMAARIVHRYACGDHTLFVGKVDEIAVDGLALPLVFYSGRYRALDPLAVTAAGMPEPYPSFF